MWAWVIKSAVTANSSLNAGDTENICIKTKAVILNLGFLLFSSSLQQVRTGVVGSSKAQKCSHAPWPGHTGMLCGMAIPPERAAAVGAASEDSVGK